MRDILVFDSHLARREGHHDRFARDLLAFAEPRDWSIRYFAHRSIAPDLAAELNARPTFRRSLYFRAHDPYDGPLTEFAWASGELPRDLDEAGIVVDEHSIVLLPTATAGQLSGLLDWFGRLPGPPPRLAAFFHRHWATGRGEPPPGSVEGALLRRVGRRLAARPPGRTLLRATNPQLADSLTRIMQAPIEPAALFKVGRVPLGPPPPIRFDVGFFGGSREEKGSGKIAALTRALLQRLKLSICVQSHLSGRSAREVEIEELRSDGNGRLTFVDGWISDSELEALIRSTRLALLLHDRAAFQFGISGIFETALEQGIPSVVLSGTTMAADIARGRAAGVVCDGTTSGEFVQAVERALADWPALSAKARACADRLRSRNPDEEFFTQLGEWIEAARQPPPACSVGS